MYVRMYICIHVCIQVRLVGPTMHHPAIPLPWERMYMYICMYKVHVCMYTSSPNRTNFASSRYFTPKMVNGIFLWAFHAYLLHVWVYVEPIYSMSVTTGRNVYPIHVRLAAPAMGWHRSCVYACTDACMYTCMHVCVRIQLHDKLLRHMHVYICRHGSKVEAAQSMRHSHECTSTNAMTQGSTLYQYICSKSPNNHLILYPHTATSNAYTPHTHTHT
jgi:hypothetical protein